MTDEEQKIKTEIIVGIKDDKVFINFPQPVVWCSFSPIEAINLARVLEIKAAQVLDSDA